MEVPLPPANPSPYQDLAAELHSIISSRAELPSDSQPTTSPLDIQVQIDANKEPQGREGAVEPVASPPTDAACRFKILMLILICLIVISLSVCLFVKLIYLPKQHKFPCWNSSLSCKEEKNCSLSSTAAACVVKKEINSTTLTSNEYWNPVMLWGSDSLLRLYRQSDQQYYSVCHQGFSASMALLFCQELGMTSIPVEETVNFRILQEKNVGKVAIINASTSVQSTEWLLRPISECPKNEVISLHCSDCGRQSAPINRILGGSPSILGRWPWQASLQWDGRHICGGSVVSKRWVVTAAHCFVIYDMLKPGDWAIIVGSLNWGGSPTGGRYNVQKIFYHQQFSRINIDYDIAMLRTTTAISFTDTVRPVCLPSYAQTFSPNSNCWISGWGYTSEGGPQVSRVLRDGQVQLIDSSVCNDIEIYPNEITPRMLCAGYLDGRVDSCQGDSGGPLVCQSKGTWWLVGIVSWGDGCGRQNRPGVYTNVSDLLDWVYHKLQVSLNIRCLKQVCFY
ncbi:transmembrane protease serine 5-like isoform X2 [Polypterus senegalus]|uniref:transmembrane protease serine 5-like isoform X2 n=1 Tax=Polypterus senegalus TaxID=55291 RepID=UPI00196679EC|nr:transmembrane protease serine 5-like isoform X2 [Polypterus senegalus]